MPVGNWTLCSVARRASIFHVCPASCVGSQCPVINSGPGSQAGAGSRGLRARILLSGQGRVQLCNAMSSQHVFASTCPWDRQTRVLASI